MSIHQTSSFEFPFLMTATRQKLSGHSKRVSMPTLNTLTLRFFTEAEFESLWTDNVRCSLTRLPPDSSLPRGTSI